MIKKLKVLKFDKDKILAHSYVLTLKKPIEAKTLKTRISKINRILNRNGFPFDCIVTWQFDGFEEGFKK